MLIKIESKKNVLDFNECSIGEIGKTPVAKRLGIGCNE
jgi:hypothetical protein